jgi:chromosomal replication initiator protein
MEVAVNQREIKRLDAAVSVAFLNHVAEEEQATLPADVALYLAHAIAWSVRDLHCAAIRLIAYASLTSQPITRALAVAIVCETFYAGVSSEAM